MKATPSVRAGRAAAAIATAAMLIAAHSSAQPQLVPVTSPELSYPQGHTDVVDVTVAIVIGTDGRVESAIVRERTPSDAPADFDEAALAFARELAFEPVIVDGEPQRLGTEIRLHFEPPAEVGTASGPVPAHHRHDSPPAPTPTFTQTVRGRRVPSGASPSAWPGWRPPTSVAAAPRA